MQDLHPQCEFCLTSFASNANKLMLEEVVTNVPFMFLRKTMSRKNVPILLLALSAALAAQSDPSGRVGRLSYINGPVSFQPAGVTDWVDADLNRPLTTGDQVWVGDRGRAEIHVGSTALRLDSNTAFQFLNLDDQTIQIQLSQGNLTVRARNLAQNQNLELDTPSLAFTVLQPGEYRINANPDSQTTNVTVRNGYGEVTGGGQTFPVQARQQAIVVGGDQITYDLVNAPGNDAWDQWSSSRDRREDASPSARYVSREMSGYEELDQYGNWSNQPGYGQVWMPNNVAAGWAPYHDGHWAWIAPWGWTWVDEAPWGFAPSHYGRWASFGDRWGWVPGPYGETPMYAPALVGWVGGGRGGSGFSMSFSSGNAAAVGWFPLGPREPYLPSYRVSSGYFGRVNTSNTAINNTTINNYYNVTQNSNNTNINSIQYANRNVQNAVTAVPQDRFANGRRVAETARPVPAAQLRAASLVAAPAIAPQQASVLGPRAAEASRAPRPPAAVFNRPVVARTAPPPAPVPFARQQAALTQNPGRPLAPAAVQQLVQAAPARTAPVRVANMAQIQRIQPTLGAGPQKGVNRANPTAASPGAMATQPPNTPQRTNATPTPALATAPNQSPSNAPGNQNGRWSTPVARPGAPVHNPASAQQNAPQQSVARPANTPPPPAVAAHPNQQPPVDNGRQNGRWSTPVARPGAPVPNPTSAQQPVQQNAPQPNVARPPAAPPPPAATNRPDQSPSNGSARQDRQSAPAVRPDATPPSPAPRQQSAPSPNMTPQPRPPQPDVARQPSVPPPNAAPQPRTPQPNVERQPSAPPPSVVRQQSAPPPSRPQPQPPVRVAPAPTPERTPVQAPQVRPAPAPKPAPAAEAKDKKDKKDRKDEKD